MGERKMLKKYYPGLFSTSQKLASKKKELIEAYDCRIDHVFGCASVDITNTLLLRI
jgi:hypothetical protein